jgi:AraC-like DNA-binding protein
MRNGNPGKALVSGPAQTGRIHFHSLRFASQLDFESAHGGELQLVFGRARATQVRVPAGWLSLCLPLAGHLQLQAAEGEWQVGAGRVQVWRDGELRMGNRGPDGWLLLTGAPSVWARHLRGLIDDAHAELFPGQHDCPRGLRRLLVRLARTLRREGLGDSRMVLEALLLELLACQNRDLGPHLARCSGRTPVRRQQTLLRLMRVRMLIEICYDHRLDMTRLARSASYSPWHLIRMYRDVFGETPSEHAQRLRMLRAWSLVRDTRLPICEITEVLGFESQSSFCRAFRQAYGTTTGDVRRLHQGASNGGPLQRAEAARAA